MTIRLNMLVSLVAPVLLGFPGITLAQSPVFYAVKLETTEQGPDANAAQKIRLTKFVERLRIELMVDNLGDVNIGCDRCGELVEGEAVDGLEKPDEPLVYLTLAMSRNSSQLEAVVKSYDYVQASEAGAAAFVLKIDGTAPPSPVCSDAQLALGCKTRQLCFQIGGCDKVYGGACNLCPVP